MSVNNWKNINQIVFIIVGLFIAISLESCNTKDDMAPVITLLGSQSFGIPLNEEYIDAGATALDETDGDITENIFVENTIDVDLLGWYTVTYNVVDKGGNSALPVTRDIRVINLRYVNVGNYLATEVQVYPEQDTCSYGTSFITDSTLNNRMVFTNFACEEGLNVYADLSGTLLLVPFQTIQDSARIVSFQGSGYIIDSLINLEYRRITDTLTTFWEATFIIPK